MKNLMANRRGFTLIEVMIALLIFSIGSIALTKGMSQVVGQQNRLEQKTFAGWIAENRYNELAAITRFPDVGEAKDEIRYAGRDWQIEEKIIRTPNPFMRRVEINVSVLNDEDNSATQVHTVTGFIGDV